MCAVALGAAGAFAAEEPRARRLVPLARETELALPLPPLAQVTSADRSGPPWRQSGELRGSVESARNDFTQVLGANGWRVEKRIAQGRLGDRSELLMLASARQRVLLLLWEIEVGKCGFAWGKER